MRVGPEEGPLVAAADARRLVHLIVILDHLEELLVDQVRLLLLLLLLPLCHCTVMKQQLSLMLR